jgi:hypothetical protein
LSPWMLYSLILFYLSRMCHGSCFGGIAVVFVPARSGNSVLYFQWCWYLVVCRYCGGCSWRSLESWLLWSGCEHWGSFQFPTATTLFLTKPGEGVRW